jgi:cob(I)alamin adenosyltransferase
MAKMTLELAEDCIRKTKEKAAEMKITMFIAVVDEIGKLVAFARMGESSIGFGEKISIAKAKTAVAYKRDTKETMDRYANYPGNYFINGMAGLFPDEFWAGPGGAPIILDGQLLGGLGVSGSTPENDHKCVTEAIANLQRK